MVNSGIPRGNQPLTAHAEGTPPGGRRYRWVMLALLWLAYFTFGTVAASLAPLVTPVINDLQISYSQMGIILGAYSLTYVLVAAVAGAVIDRWGIRKSIFVGILFISLSEGLRYFAGGFGTMFAFVAMFGIGGPTISIGAPKTISLWFRGKERGTAVGMYLTGVWIGQGVILTTMNSVVMPLAGYSWRIAFACFGLLAFAAALLWLLLARDMKPAEVTERVSINKVFGGLISIRNVQLVIIVGALTFAIGYGFSGWLPKMLEVSGLSPAVAGITASIPIWVSIPTVVSIPRMVAPHLRGRVIALVSFTAAAAILIVAMTSGVPRMLGLILYGLSYCCSLPLLLLILMDLPEVGSKYMGSVSGMFFCLAEMGGFLGPIMVGAIKDWVGGFLAGAFLLAGFSLIRMAVALSVRIKPARNLTAT